MTVTIILATVLREDRLKNKTFINNALYLTELVSKSHIDANLFPVLGFQQSTKRPHDGEDDQFLHVMNANFFIFISASEQAFEQVSGLPYVHALQHLCRSLSYKLSQ